MLATLYSAIDPRIDVALEISGMSPASAQLDTTVFRGIAAELDLTIPQLYDQVPTVLLQTAGGRLGSFHFYSSADPCCFAFPAGHPFVSYLNELSVTTRGRVRAYVGHQPVHGLDEIALARLGQFLDQIGLGAADGGATVSSTTTAAPR
jgi:hypothetical protein